MRDSWDVLGIGAVSVDFFGTTQRWPAAGEKERMHSFSVQDGGLVGTALVAVCKLGGQACCAGELGSSEMAERALRALENEGVDTSLVLRTPGTEPCVSVVLCVEGGQRTIFSSQAGVSFPSPKTWPDVDWHRKTRVLLIDHVSGQVGIEAAKIARDHGVTVIIDAERQTDLVDEALASVNHIVVPLDFALLNTGTSDVKEMLRRIRRVDDQTVIITCGSRGCYGLTNDHDFHIPAYAINAVDTTGCGDVFHGAYALMIARGKSVVESARFASAAAALSATQIGGRTGIPMFEGVQRLMQG
jgi:sugar/nucleoside kinase (ribokinase family)